MSSEQTKGPLKCATIWGRPPLPWLVVRGCAAWTQLLSPCRRIERACGLDKSSQPWAPGHPAMRGIPSIWVPRAFPRLTIMTSLLGRQQNLGTLNGPCD